MGKPSVRLRSNSRKKTINIWRFRKNPLSLHSTNGVLAQLVERLNGIQKVRSSILLCSTKQTENQSLKVLTHKFTHKTCASLCVISFTILPLYFGCCEGVRLPELSGTETSTPYVRPDTKKSCPLKRRQEIFFALGPETWKED